MSTVATASLAVLPESFNRPIAVPEGVALIALGISLWRDQRNNHSARCPPNRRRAARSPMNTKHTSLGTWR